MKRTSWLNVVAVILFCVTLAAFFSFFLYISTSEQVSIYQSEQTHNYGLLEGMQQQIVSDDSAPLEIRKVYRGILSPEQSMESCLCFNISHHSIAVYFDDELVYSLAGQDSNRIGKNVSSNWCSVHVGQANAGKNVTVVLTPMIEAAISKEPEFLLGSHYSIAMDILTGDLPMLVLSILCIILGMLLVVAFLYFRFVLHSESASLAYLGLFSIVLGIWKTADLRCMPLLFPESSMALGYISVGSLFLTSLCLFLYFSTLFWKNKQDFLLLLSCCGSLICLYVLASQILGASEIRQNLIFSHFLLILSVISIPLSAVYNRIVFKTWGILRSWKLLLLLFIGITIDLGFYYWNNGNDPLSFSVISFIVYTLIFFFKTILHSTQKAYTDSRTGLTNRIRWNELMDENLPIPEPFGLLMIDLNGLKQINDTLGHEAGDRMIFQFSSILCNTMPKTSVICRWGGDEFAILLTDADREKTDSHISALYGAVEKHNADNPELPIHYAVGTALTTEHPGLSRNELFRIADREMYLNKQTWYTHQ